MARILLITSRNVVNTCGELRLIKNRIRALYGNWDIKTDIFALVDRLKLSKPREDIGFSSTQMIFPFSKLNYLSYIVSLYQMKKAIMRYLEDQEPGCIVISGDRVLPLARYLRTNYPNVRLVIDIHGAYEELIEFPPDDPVKRLLYQFVYQYACRVTKSAIAFFDGALVVSGALQSYIEEKYHLSNLKYYIVPCATNWTTIDVAEASGYRSKWRKAFGIADEDLLFVYSGGVSRWQSIDASKDLYTKVRMKLQSQGITSKLLIVSSNISELGYLADETTIVASFNPDEVHEVLFAGDIGFLLRDDYVTNHVAFPNKFMEYALSGVMIVTTPYVYDVAMYLQKYDLGVLIDGYGDAMADKIVNSIGVRSDFGEVLRKRQQIIDDLCYENTLRPFVTDLDEVYAQ